MGPIGEVRAWDPKEGPERDPAGIVQGWDPKVRKFDAFAGRGGASASAPGLLLGAPSPLNIKGPGRNRRMPLELL